MEREYYGPGYGPGYADDGALAEEQATGGGGIWSLLRPLIPGGISDVLQMPFVQNLFGSITDKVTDIAGVTGGSVGGAVDEALKKANPMQYMVSASAAKGYRQGPGGNQELEEAYKLHEPLSQLAGADFSRTRNAVANDIAGLRGGLARNLNNIGQRQGNLLGSAATNLRRGAGNGPLGAYGAAQGLGEVLRQSNADVYGQMADAVSRNYTSAAGVNLGLADATNRNADIRNKLLVEPYKITHDSSVANSVAGATASAAGQSAGTTAAGVAQKRLIPNQFDTLTTLTADKAGQWSTWDTIMKMFG